VPKNDTPAEGELCMIIHHLSRKKDERDWDDYVAANGTTTFFHQIAWKKLVEKFYNLKPFYFMAEGSSEIKGILRLFLV
jgi:hypothetical protein